MTDAEKIKDYEGLIEELRENLLELKSEISANTRKTQCFIDELLEALVDEERE